MIDSENRFRGCLLGLAVGDAVGTTVEFCARGSFPPVVDMVGQGPFNLKAGEWTDDTSMALCLAASLVEKGGFDPKDQMERYCRWIRSGYMSSNGRCFDVGRTVAGALRRFEQSGEAYSGSDDPWSAGNGCIMRLAPVPMFYHRDYPAAIRWSAESSRTTHACRECLEASSLFGAVLFKALQGCAKSEILFEHRDLPPLSAKVEAIAKGQYRDKDEGLICGSGYVVDCLEAALWCFLRTESFKDAILMAANLGDDADTTAAVCGQVAGAFYGDVSIPSTWLDKLALREQITALADALRIGPGVA